MITVHSNMSVQCLRMTDNVSLSFCLQIQGRVNKGMRFCWKRWNRDQHSQSLPVCLKYKPVIIFSVTFLNKQNKCFNWFPRQFLNEHKPADAPILSVICRTSTEEFCSVFIVNFFNIKVPTDISSFTHECHEVAR